MILVNAKEVDLYSIASYWTPCYSFNRRYLTPMAFNWKNMDAEFVEKCKALLANLKDQGTLMVPYFGYRTLEQQAKLWRQGRPTQQIIQMINKLKAENAPYLASQIENVGPQPGEKIVTDALPGCSWHNWGMALDCYATINNDPMKPNWDGRAPAYKKYADAAKKMGLTAGADFVDIDYDHIQLLPKEVFSDHNPHMKTLQEVNDYFAFKS